MPLTGTDPTEAPIHPPLMGTTPPEALIHQHPSVRPWFGAGSAPTAPDPNYGLWCVWVLGRPGQRDAEHPPRAWCCMASLWQLSEQEDDSVWLSDTLMGDG